MIAESRPPEVVRAESLKSFFESVQPGRMFTIPTPDYPKFKLDGNAIRIELLQLELHCMIDGCNGVRFFQPDDSLNAGLTDWNYEFINYTCRNCGEGAKVYAIQSKVDGKLRELTLMKLGEDPPFGPPTPARVIALVGSEREYFLKGRRAELQGLGIGAFAYYRRVIENQKNKIFDEIIRVSEHLNASNELLHDLAVAKQETQFSKAVEAVKHGIPQVLLVNGQNPLTLLHSALSEGLHAQSDEECLELATAIRVILTEFVERVATALKDEVELNNAVNRLIQARKPKTHSDKPD
jgi:hypothetical protein